MPPRLNASARRNTTKYEDRGWCILETAAAFLHKPTHCVINLGRYEIGFDYGQNEPWFYPKQREHAAIMFESRPPQLTPNAFDKVIDNAKFTNGKDDRALTKKQYRDMFEDASSSTDFLTLTNLGWTAVEVGVFCKSLKFYSQLRTLHLSGNPIGDEGARLLMETLSSCSKLRKIEKLHLENCGLSDAILPATLKFLDKATAINVVRLHDNPNISERARAEILDCWTRSKKSIDSNTGIYFGNRWSRRHKNESANGELSGSSSESSGLHTDCEGY